MRFQICHLNQRNLEKRGVEENACGKIKISPEEDKVDQRQSKVETIEQHTDILTSTLARVKVLDMQEFLKVKNLSKVKLTEENLSQ